MKYLFVLIFIIVYACFGMELGYTEASPWWTHFTYSFQHANFWHLLLNSISFFMFFRLLQRYIPFWLLALGSWLVAVGVSFLHSYTQAVVGASGMIYSMIGIYIAFIIIKKIRYRDKKNLIIFFICLSLVTLVSFLKENSALALHLLCMLWGAILPFILFKCKSISKF